MNRTESPQRVAIDLSVENPLDTVNRTALARAVGIDVSVISRLLRRQRTVQIHTFKRIAGALGMTMDDLYGMLYK